MATFFTLKKLKLHLDICSYNEKTPQPDGLKNELI